MSALERVKEYADAADTMTATHKGTPHTANDKPLTLADLRALVAVVEAVDSALPALEQYADELGALNEILEHGQVLRLLAALRAATEAP